MLDLSLEGQVALVTGASRGIGRAIALALADCGADVALAGRDEHALGEVAAEAEARGRRALPVAADVADAAAAQGLIERTIRGFGSIDILVNNAGAAPF